MLCILYFTGILFVFLINVVTLCECHSEIKGYLLTSPGAPVEGTTKWGRDPPPGHEKGQYLGVVRPIEKHLKSVLQCTQQKGSVSHQ